MTEHEDLQPQRVTYALPLHKPVVTWILLGIIVVVFGLETLAGGSTDTEVLIRLGAKFNPLIAAGEYWRLFTAMFLHIGVMHLAFNGYALVAIGTEVERLLGWGRFLAIYILSGLFGSLVSYALNPHIAAGASGAIFGLIGTLAAFFTLHRQMLGTWGRNRLLNTLFLITINLFLGFTQPGIDNYAHLGGLVAGFALGWALTPRYEVDPYQHRVVDHNRFARYWPALAVAVLLFVAGTVLATGYQRDSLQTHLLRAEQAIEREAWNEAIVELEQVLAKDPDSADATLYFYLGLAHNYQEHPQEAAQAYESALKLDPEYSPSLWNLALTYLELDRPVEAREHFETYLQLNPDEAAEVQPYLEILQPTSP